VVSFTPRPVIYTHIIARIEFSGRNKITHVSDTDDGSFCDPEDVESS
jgi:hypothetical protein